MAVFCPLSTTPVYYNGKPVSGAYIRVYDAGGNTPRTAYSDGLLTTPYDPNGIRTDASGRIPKIWVQGNPYKLKITTAAGVVIETIDDLPGDVASGGGGGGGGGGTTIPTGFIMAFHGTGTVTNWLRCNGRTIGNVSSGATEYAAADAETLFTHLWNSDPTLAVSSGRGASAAADWAANKTIALPDYRGRALSALADMGNTAATTYSGLTFTTGNATTLGSTVGTSTHTLTTAQMPAHTHTASTSTIADHTHVATTAGAGAHNHTGATNGGGTHTHSGSTTAGGGHVVAITGATSYSAGGGNTYFGVWSGTTSANQTIPDHAHSLSIDGVGDHVHTFTTSSVADHTHTVTVSAGGSHAHTVTVDSAGSGSAHPIMQPTVLVSFMIKM